MSAATMHTRDTPIIDQITLWLGGLIAVAGSLATVTQVTDLHPAIPVALNCIMVGGGALLMYLRGPAQAATVPAEDVVEVAVGSEVYAGDGHDTLAAGDQVRQLEPALPFRRRDRRTHDHP